MFSVIITTLKEPKTLPKAIQSVLRQNLKDDFEVLVVGPGRETENIARNFSKKYTAVRYLKDKRQGKPAALNLAFKQAEGEILVLTDGDVLIGQNSLRHLLRPFKDLNVGAVSGRPVSVNSRETMFGYWSHFLTAAAHQWRLKDNYFPCSGYLYAFRNIVRNIPEKTFAEDGIITSIIRGNNYQVVYAPEAEVYVKYPDNFRDWLKQKIRSTGGYVQKSETNPKKTRTFRQEIKDGLILFFTYPKTVKEFFWTFLLYSARIYLWLMIFWNIKIKNKGFNDIWQRVESTK